MNTLLTMLVLMTTPYLLVTLLSVLKRRDLGGRTAAAAGLALLFLFTGISHFVETEAMAAMLPPWVPGRTLLVYGTGILEVLLAVALLVPRSRRAAGWVAAALLVLFFPANVYAALNHIPFGGHGQGPPYLLVRAPMQILILLWTYGSTIRAPRVAVTGPATTAPSPAPIPRS